MAIYSVAILATENRNLRAANKKIVKKREKKKQYISKGGAKTSREVQEAQNQAIIVDKVQNQGISQIQAPSLERAQRLCSLYRLLTYTARTCPEFQ